MCRFLMRTALQEGQLGAGPAPAHTLHEGFAALPPPRKMLPRCLVAIGMQKLKLKTGWIKAARGCCLARPAPNPPAPCRSWAQHPAASNQSSAQPGHLSICLCRGRPGFRRRNPTCLSAALGQVNHQPADVRPAAGSQLSQQGHLSHPPLTASAPPTRNPCFAPSVCLRDYCDPNQAN